MTTPIQDDVGAKRFKSGIEFQKELLQIARSVQDRLLIALPSNYPRDRNTNLAEFFRALAMEFARVQVSSSDINQDDYHSETRVQYLYQILGDILFLGDKAINEDINDIDYRAFLIKVRDAYFGGSRKDNIETAVSDIIGMDVTLRELYLEARKENSSYSLKDTHTMFFDIQMDDITPSSTLGTLLENIKFFIDMIKPAHVKYDTRLIWTDPFLNKEGTCTPEYDTQPSGYDVRYITDLYMVTYDLNSLYKMAGGTGIPLAYTGTIANINTTRKIIYPIDGRSLVYDTSTLFYSHETGNINTTITVSGFTAGDGISYFATKDSPSSSDVIDTTWGYTGIIDTVDLNKEIIDLVDSSILVYNNETLFHTRDGVGEYRIEADDLRIGVTGVEVSYNGTRFTQEFKFYNTPSEVATNYFKQFDQEVIDKPYFQENVKKIPDIEEGYVEGPQVIIENGIATVVDIESKFARRSNNKDYRERKIMRYSLYIDDVHQKTFSEYDPARSLTNSEAKTIFIDAYGYTGLELPNVDYHIDVARTADLVEDGDAAILEAIGTQTESCDRRASCLLTPFYEDIRGYPVWPDLQLTSGFFTISHEFDPMEDAPGEQNLPAWYYISEDPNTYQMPSLPMLGSDGTPADPSDLTVYINGLLVEDAIASVDPWNGIVALNFLPPYNSFIRIDYWHSQRYPSPQYCLRRIGTGMAPLYGDTGLNEGAMMSIISTSGTVKQLYWPFEPTDVSLYGDDRDHQMDKFPMLNQYGELAAYTDVSVAVGSVIVNGTLEVQSTSGTTSTLKVLSGDLIDVEDGDTIIITIPNSLNSVTVYSIQSVDTITETVVIPSIFPNTQSSYGYTIVRFVVQPGAVTAVRPLLGHVRVNFIAPAGSILRFNYYYTYQPRNYLIVPDCPITASSEEYGSSDYTVDTYYGPRSGYTLLPDQTIDEYRDPYWAFDELLKYGYRYRAFDLASSSLLNSETLTVSDYDKYGPRASFKNRGGVLNEYNLMFSAEYLTDTSRNVILNDKYLEKDLTPATVLQPGVPLIIESQTDDAHYKLFAYADEEPSYDPGLTGGQDIEAGFAIIDPDKAGVIDYNPTCEYATNKRATLYADLKKVIHDNGGYDAPLSSISEGGSTIPFSTTVIDQYYPNREMRVNDYLDYINQVPEEYKTGNIHILNGSKVLKSRTTNLRALRIGDTLTLQDVPSSGYTGVKDLEYTIIDCVDAQTAEFSRPFEGDSGEYAFDLVRYGVYANDVLLNRVIRPVVLSNSLGYDYGIPAAALTGMPGWGETGYSIYFPDSDTDPYPRQPDNPSIPYPTVFYYPITGCVIDGKTYRTNRLYGVTGTVLTSQVVDAYGNSYGFTGPFSYGPYGYYETGYYGFTGEMGVTGPFYTGIYGGNSGYTGPSSALNLGITGPVDEANPRVWTDDDVYIIPAGDTGVFASYSEAEYRVQWRDWDQGLCVAYLGVTGGGLTGTLAGLTGTVVFVI